MDWIVNVESVAWIGWLVLVALFLVIEMLTLEFTFLMLAVGSVAGLISDVSGAPLWLQVIDAAVVSVLLLLFLRPPLLRRLRRGEDPTPTNVAALLGSGGTIVHAVSEAGGQVKLANGEIWSARSDRDLEVGARVRVTNIDGATAVVTPTEETRP